MTDVLAAIILLWLWLRFREPGPKILRRGWRTAADGEPLHLRTRRKPGWVPESIIHIKAMRPQWSGRHIAQVFNRMFAARRQMTVGRTYVCEIIRKHQHEIAEVRQRVRNRKSRPGPINRTWGVDLTGKIDSIGNLHMILGVIDHGSRKSLSLVPLKTKASIAILRALLDVIENHGMPRFIRTDNEPCFTSRLFRFGLQFLGIKHQTTDLHCPWQNGRIERFFGTLKQKLDRWAVPDFETLQHSLVEFRFWYNAVRPHQSLYGRTPAEVWNSRDIYRRGPKAVIPYDAWDGLLSGIYLPT